MDEYHGPYEGVHTCMHTQCWPQRMSALGTSVVGLSTFVWCCLYCCIMLECKRECECVHVCVCAFMCICCHCTCINAPMPFITYCRLWLFAKLPILASHMTLIWTNVVTCHHHVFCIPHKMEGSALTHGIHRIPLVQIHHVNCRLLQFRKHS